MSVEQPSTKRSKKANDKANASGSTVSAAVDVNDHKHLNASVTLLRTQDDLIALAKTTAVRPPDHQRAGISPAENDPEAAVRLLSRTRLRERKRLATNSTPSDMRALLSRHCSCWGGR